MIVKREDLKAALGRVAPLVKTRTTLPILSCVLLKALNSGLRIVASDADLFMEASCSCKGELEACCVPPGPLQALCHYGPDTMELTLSENRLKVVCGATASLSVLSPEEFPKWPEGLKDLGVNPADFADAIEAVAWAAGRDKFSPIHQLCVWVSLVTKDKRILSSSNRQKALAVFSRPAIVPDATLLFLAEYAESICEALRGPSPSVKYSDNWLCVRNETSAVAVKQAEGKYPTIKYIVEDDTEEVGEVATGPIMETLSTMRAMSNGDPFVRGKLSFTKKGLEFEYAGKTSDFRAVVDATLTGNPSPIHCDASLLHDVLKHTPGTALKCRISKTGMYFYGGDLTSICGLLSGEY